MHSFNSSFHRLVRWSGHSGEPAEGHPYLRRSLALGRDICWGKVRRTMAQGSQKSGSGSKCIDSILCAFAISMVSCCHLDNISVNLASHDQGSQNFVSGSQKFGPGF